MTHVLVIDDQPMIREAALTYFKAAGIEVTTVRDLTSAKVELEKKGKPLDILLTDWNYPVQFDDKVARQSDNTGGLRLLQYLKELAATGSEQLPKQVFVMSDMPGTAQRGVEASGFNTPVVPTVFPKGILMGSKFKPIIDTLKP